MRKFARAKIVPGGPITSIGPLQQMQNITLPDINDPDFIVWMRPAITNSFTKLYRIIQKQKFKKGDVLSVRLLSVCVNLCFTLFHATQFKVFVCNRLIVGSSQLF